VRIVWVGPYYSTFSVVGWLKVKALRSLGHEVVIFDNREVRLPLLKWLPTPICHRLRRKIERLAELDIVLMNKQLLHTVKAVKPDLVVADKALNVSRSTIEQIGKMGAITANWFPDNLNFLDWMREISGCYSYFFHFDPYVVSILRGEGQKNVHYLPFGCDPDLHRGVVLSDQELEKYGCDVCFTGAYYPEREEALSCLTDFNLKIWGYRNWMNTELRKFYHGTISNGEDMVKAYNACKIALNIHYHLTGDGANYRTFEITGCGAFQIVDDRKDLASLFEVGQEVVTYEYKNLSDLEEKVRYYLNNDQKRIAIAQKGQERAHRDHTLQQRMDRLIQVVTRGGEGNKNFSVER
jgi:spore maturation protein CgeB